MERSDFLDAIFAFFKVKDDGKTQYKAYDLALSTGHNIDWDKMYLKTIETVETRYLPAPKFFINLFSQCQIISVQESKYFGYKIRIYFSDEKYRDFIFTGYGLNVQNIVNRENNIRKIVMFPPETTLIGKNIVPENSKYKILYIAA